MDTAAQGILTRDEMESRRLLAAQDLQTGLSQSQVARKFGVSRTTASRWNRTLSGKGVESLRKRRAPGRPSRLTADRPCERYGNLSVRASYPPGLNPTVGRPCVLPGDPNSLWCALRSGSRRPNHAQTRATGTAAESETGCGRYVRYPVSCSRGYFRYSGLAAADSWGRTELSAVDLCLPPSLLCRQPGYISSLP